MNIQAILSNEDLELLSPQTRRNLKYYAFMKKVSYKPGWRINLITNQEISDFLTISVPAPDATLFQVVKDYNLPEPKPAMLRKSVAINKDLLDSMTEQQILEWIQKAIIALEIHEVHEWYKFDGTTVTDPHPEESY